MENPARVGQAGGRVAPVFFREGGGGFLDGFGLLENCDDFPGRCI